MKENEGTGSDLVAVNSVAEKQSWAVAMAPAALLPKAYRENPANLFLAAELADSLGIDRINALTSIHVVEGKPSASADLMAALVRRSGHKLRITGDDKSATAQLVRADDPDFTFEATWTLDRARTAGLASKDVWKKYPAAMLRSRVITEVIRSGASEVLVGMIYTPEELGVTVDQQGNPTAAMPVTTRVTAAEVMGNTVPDPVTVEPEPVDVTYAEVIEDDAPFPISKDQVAWIQAYYSRHGMTDRDKRLAHLSEKVGREVGSTNDLTSDEAHSFITRADDAERAAGQPA